MKKEYIKPFAELIKFEQNDIIRTSELKFEKYRDVTGMSAVEGEVGAKLDNGTVIMLK